MAQFIPFDYNVEVRGETVLTVTLGVEEFFRPKITEIMIKNNLENPEAAKWYKQQDWLAVMKEIDNFFGAHTLFKIGMAIPDNAIFPQGVTGLKNSLENINKAYYINHRGGEIGYYKIKDWSEKDKQGNMECKTPYPCHFDRGIITKIANTHKPKESNGVEVYLDSSKPSRLNGSNSSWYIIKW